MYKEITNCRSCKKSDLVLVLSLGNQYVIDFVKEKDENALRAPLDLVLCKDCGLLQLKHSVEPDRLYKKFWYRSGINEAMKEALRGVANSAVIMANLQPGDRVLDIGMNDGTMLSMYPTWVKTVGVDPCTELVKEAVEAKRVDIGLAGYFKAKGLKKHGPFQAITAVAMFYDLEDPGQFLEDIKEVMTEEGVFIIQMNYLLTMFQDMTLDNISHEHLCYYSLTTLQNLCEEHGLEIKGAEVNNVNGGSVRVYIMRRGRTVTSYRIPNERLIAKYVQMKELLAEEVRSGLGTPEAYREFGERAELVKCALRGYLQAKKDAGKKLYLYGASTRGGTLLQYLDLPEGTFIAAAERDPHKYDLLTVGTWVPIKPEIPCREDAEVFLLLPYHFRDGILKREKEWLEKGGTFVVPLPEPQVVTQDETYGLLTGQFEGV